MRLKRDEPIEIRRQVFHSLAIFIVPLIYWAGPQLSIIALTFFLLFISTIAYYRKFRKRFGRLSAIGFFLRIEAAFENWVSRYERPSEREGFPLKGPVTLTLGILLALVFFPANAAPAVAVLALADAASTVVGKTYGRHKLPINRKKSWEGSLAFFLSSFAVLVFFAAPLRALLVSLLVTFVEGLPELDDNITIPLAVSALLAFI